MWWPTTFTTLVTSLVETQLPFFNVTPTDLEQAWWSIQTTSIPSSDSNNFTWSVINSKQVSISSSLQNVDLFGKISPQTSSSSDGDLLGTQKRVAAVAVAHPNMVKPRFRLIGKFWACTIMNYYYQKFSVETLNWLRIYINLRERWNCKFRAYAKGFRCTKNWSIPQLKIK